MPQFQISLDRCRHEPDTVYRIAFQRLKFNIHIKSGFFGKIKGFLEKIESYLRTEGEPAMA
jgi:hypothetical protein